MNKLKISRIRLGLAVLSAALMLGTASCERSAFQKAEKANTIEAFEQFMKKYPKSDLRSSAEGHIAQLSFAQAAKEGTAEAYRKFVRAYPNAMVTPQAEKILGEMAGREAQNLSDEQIARMRAVITTDFGTIKIKFLPAKAPHTCRNFIKLAMSLYYDFSQFVIIVPGVMVQGGAPGGDLRAGPGYTIKAEPSDLRNLPGAVGMALFDHPDSAGSQFYICLKALPDRDGKYTVFAQVEEGLETVEVISDRESSGPSGQPFPFKPMQPIYIKSVEIVQEK
jgi:peptidyl-prolyl cis-trans isomerase B (cyclophilin B)